MKQASADRARRAATDGANVRRRVLHPDGRRPAWRRCALAAALALAALPSQAQKWTFNPGVALSGTLTNNVNLDPTDAREGDFVTQITPSLQFSGLGERTRLDGFVSLPVLLYARTGAENNKVFPTVNLLGDVNFFDRVFHIEGAVNVTQQFLNPFGAQPVDLTSATDNRYTSVTYRISPYIKGETPNGIAYELRNNNVWSNLSGAPVSTDNSRYTEFLGRISTRQDRKIGVAANYDYTETTFEDQDGSLQMQVGRIVPFYAVTPQLRFDAVVGYEDNRGVLTDYNGAVYGVGFRWRPGERTDVVGNWEHRFFGSSYLFSLDHRTPLSVWNVRASRNVTTYPQQLATLTGGTNVASFLNTLYATSIPDPAQRQQAIAELMSQRGLPATLSGPVTLYSQEIQLQQQQSATVGLIGARNTLTFTVYNIKTEPVSASGTVLPPLLGDATNNTQTGGALVWTNRLTPSLNLATTLDLSRTVAPEPFAFTTRQGSVNMLLSRPLGAYTTGFVGVRYQSFSGDASPGYNETAAFFGVNYLLR